MKKLNKNESGFGAVEIIIIVLVIGLLGVAGWLVYSRSLNKSNGSSNTSAKSVDPYSGWKSYTFKNEKATFKYPSKWLLSDSTGLFKNDDVALIAPNGDLFSIETGRQNMDYQTTVIYSVPLTFLGQKAYMNYFGENKDQISNAALSKSATTNFESLFANKNVKPSKLTGGYFKISIQNKRANYLTVSEIKADANFADAKLILESMTY